MQSIYQDIIEAESLEEAKEMVLLKFQEQKDDKFLDLYSQNKLQYPICSRQQLISLTINQIRSQDQQDYIPLIFTDIITLDVHKESQEEASEFLTQMNESRGIIYIVPFNQIDKIQYLCYGISK